MRLVRLLIGLLFTLLAAAGVYAQDAPAPDYFVTATVDKVNPFVGERVIYSFQFYDALFRTEDDGIFINPINFDDFWRVDIGLTERVITQNNRTYDVNTYQIALYPTRMGIITIEPATLTISPTVFRDAQELNTDVLTLDVRPLPEGAPEHFNGGVGQFQMSAAVDRLNVPVGEPVTVMLTITGTGNLEQLAPPFIPETGTWRIFDNPTQYTAPSADGLTQERKVFEWQFVPTQSGQLTLPEITLPYFDPQSVTYRSIASAPVRVEVSPIPENESQLPEPTAVAAQLSALAIKAVPKSLGQGTGTHLGAVFWLVIFVPPVATVGLWLWTRRQRRHAALLAKAGQTNPLFEASEKLQTVRDSRHIHDAVYGYFGNRLNRDATGLTEADFFAALKARGFAVELTKALAICLERINQSTYAGGNGQDNRQLAARALEILRAIDQLWSEK